MMEQVDGWMDDATTCKISVAGTVPLPVPSGWGWLLRCFTVGHASAAAANDTSHNFPICNIAGFVKFWYLCVCYCVFCCVMIVYRRSGYAEKDRPADARLFQTTFRSGARPARKKKAANVLLTALKRL